MAEQHSNKPHTQERATLAKIRRRLQYEGKALLHAPPCKARERLGMQNGVKNFPGSWGKER